MLKSIDFDVSMIDRVYVAGGIGSGINMRNAVRIGMFPDIEDLFFQALIKKAVILQKTQTVYHLKQMIHSLWWYNDTKKR